MQDAHGVLDQLMRQHGSNLLRLCTLILQDASLAQDAVQDTFLRAFHRFDTYRGDAAAKTWLTAIAVNVCRDYRRSAWHRHVDRRRDAAEMPEPSADFHLPDNTVINEVMRLPDNYREVILLRYYQGMTHKDVADALRLSDRAVRKRLHRANEILRDRLKEWYEDEG